MLLLWYASFLTSIITLVFGITRRSWLFMLVSTITLIPFAYYFFGANNALKYIGLTPIIILLLTTFFWFSERKTKAI
jgi:hypothetical protein